MAGVKLDGNIESLRSERERLREVVEGLKEGIREVERSLLRIEEAFPEFERRPPESIGKYDPEKEIVRRVDVVSIIEDELKRKGVVDRDVLKLYVEQEVERRGKSTVGLELSMRGALSDERFVDTPGGFRLKAEVEERFEEGKREEPSMLHALTDLQRKQMRQAEELLFSGPPKVGFAKDLFLGKFRAASMLPYPSPPAELKTIGDEAVTKVREFCQKNIDADSIDRNALIPDSVIEGLAEIGVLGMTIAPQYGGQGMSQQSYCRVMEVIGGHCASTAVFVNVQHSIGLRALALFGTEEQKLRWMKPLATGKQISAFALTEPKAGSDASNVQTTATPTPDGIGYILNGEKRWITNGAIAQVLTVMARTPDSRDPEGRITAFLVTPDMDGFQVIEARMEKCGIRGTATAQLAFDDMFVPKENVLGPVGHGLRVALTVLDFGRITFGASCTGAAMFCVERMQHRANSRKQFGRHLGEFELVKSKLAEAAADTFAMQSATYHTAALIDSGAGDCMVEAAMLKVFASDQLWRIVNDTMQIWGGKGYFTDEPFERMMRDARLNQIAEGANDVLRCFIAMVGMRGLGEELKGVLKKPWQTARMLRLAPSVPTKHVRLRRHAASLAKQIGRFARAAQRALIQHREGILDQQFIQARIGDVATELFMASCVYSRLDSLLSTTHHDEEQRDRELATGELYMKLAELRNRERLAQLKLNSDTQMVSVANSWLVAATLPVAGEA